MNIKKVDDKPMVIHTKEKPKLKVKGTRRTKIKGRNVLTVRRGPKIAGTVAGSGKLKLKKSSVHVTDKRKTVQTKTAADGMGYRGGNSGRTTQGRNSGTTQGRMADRNTQGRAGKEQEIWQSVNRENRMYARHKTVEKILFDNKEGDLLYPIETIHGCKGMSLDAVFFLSSYQASNDEHSGGYWKQWFDRENIGEENRLAYVAFSRARYLLALGIPKPQNFSEEDRKVLKDAGFEIIEN